MLYHSYLQINKDVGKQRRREAVRRSVDQCTAPSSSEQTATKTDLPSSTFLQLSKEQAEALVARVDTKRVENFIVDWFVEVVDGILYEIINKLLNQEDELNSSNSSASIVVFFVFLLVGLLAICCFACLFFSDSAGSIWGCWRVLFVLLKFRRCKNHTKTEICLSRLTRSMQCWRPNFHTNEHVVRRPTWLRRKRPNNSELTHTTCTCILLPHAHSRKHTTLRKTLTQTQQSHTHTHYCKMKTFCFDVQNQWPVDFFFYHCRRPSTVWISPLPYVRCLESKTAFNDIHSRKGWKNIRWGVMFVICLYKWYVSHGISSMRTVIHYPINIMCWNWWMSLDEAKCYTGLWLFCNLRELFEWVYYD